MPRFKDRTNDKHGRLTVIFQLQKMTKETKIDRVIWRRDLQETVQVSSETIRLWINSGKLPKPDVQITGRTAGWKLSPQAKGRGFIAPH